MLAGSPGRGASASLRAWSRLCSLAAIMALLVALAPAAAAESRSQCRKLSRQIAHFDDVLAMAREHGNASWEKGTKRHIRQLEERQRKRCPNYLAAIKANKLRIAAEKTRQFVVAAAKAAVRYFAFGGF